MLKNDRIQVLIAHDNSLVADTARGSSVSGRKP
jgi:hypothetical protein